MCLVLNDFLYALEVSLSKKRSATLLWQNTRIATAPTLERGAHLTTICFTKFRY